MADHLKMEAGRFSRTTDICRLQPANKHDDLGCEVVTLKTFKMCKISKVAVKNYPKSQKDIEPNVWFNEMSLKNAVVT